MSYSNNVRSQRVARRGRPVGSGPGHRHAAASGGEINLGSLGSLSMATHFNKGRVERSLKLNSGER